MKHTLVREIFKWWNWGTKCWEYNSDQNLGIMTKNIFFPLLQTIFLYFWGAIIYNTAKYTSFQHHINHQCLLSSTNFKDNFHLSPYSSLCNLSSLDQLSSSVAFDNLLLPYYVFFLLLFNKYNHISAALWDWFFVYIALFLFIIHNFYTDKKWRWQRTKLEKQNELLVVWRILSLIYCHVWNLYWVDKESAWKIWSEL